MEFKKIFSFPKKQRSIVEEIKVDGIDVIFNYVDENKNSFYKIAWAYVQNHDDIEDIFQNTIIKVYEHINELRNEKYFKTWITSILINECRKVIKAKRKIENYEYLQKENSHDNSVVFENRETKIDLIMSLKKLEPIYKEVIILKYYGGYSQEEIADILKVPIGTVKSRIYRAIKMLKEVLENEEV